MYLRGAPVLFQRSHKTHKPHRKMVKSTGRPKVLIILSLSFLSFSQLFPTLFFFYYWVDPFCDQWIFVILAT